MASASNTPASAKRALTKAASAPAISAATSRVGCCRCSPSTIG